MSQSVSNGVPYTDTLTVIVLLAYRALRVHLLHFNCDNFLFEYIVTKATESLRINKKKFVDF